MKCLVNFERNPKILALESLDVECWPRTWMTYLVHFLKTATANSFLFSPLWWNDQPQLQLTSASFWNEPVPAKDCAATKIIRYSLTDHKHSIRTFRKTRTIEKYSEKFLAYICKYETYCLLFVNDNFVNELFTGVGLEKLLTDLEECSMSRGIGTICQVVLHAVQVSFQGRTSVEWKYGNFYKIFGIPRFRIKFLWKFGIFRILQHLVDVLMS